MDGFPVKVTEAACLGASLALSGICYYLYRKSRTTLDKLDVSCISCVIKIMLHHSILLYWEEWHYLQNHVNNPLCSHTAWHPLCVDNGVCTTLCALCCQDAPHFTIDGKLKDILKVTPGACLQYAVVEGKPVSLFLKPPKTEFIFSTVRVSYSLPCVHTVGVVRPAGEPLTSHFQKEFVGVLQKFLLREHRLVWNSLSRTWWELLSRPEYLASSLWYFIFTFIWYWKV